MRESPKKRNRKGGRILFQVEIWPVLERESYKRKWYLRPNHLIMLVISWLILINLSSTGEVGKFHAHKPWEEFRNLALCYHVYQWEEVWTQKILVINYWLCSWIFGWEFIITASLYSWNMDPLTSERDSLLTLLILLWAMLFCIWRN